MTTHWSVVSDFSHKSEPSRAEAALTQLCRDYWPPLYWFVRRRGYNHVDAQDLTQGFFNYLFEQKVFPAADPTKGRFRTFLLVLFKRYLSATRKYESRGKRGGGEPLIRLDSEADAPDNLKDSALVVGAPLDEERLFEQHWAASLVQRAMTALEADYSQKRQVQILAELRPFLTGGTGLPTHEMAAARLGVSTETLRSHLFRLRTRYRVLLRAEVLRTVAREEDIDDELRYLCRVLVARA